MTYSLSAKIRTVTGKTVKRLRTAGMVPAVIYGQGVPAANLEFSYGDFEKIYRQAGQSSLISVSWSDQKPVMALITDVAKDPVTDRYIHVDFRQVDMSKKMRATVPFHFVGESRAVKETAAVLTKTLQEVEIECLPDKLPHQIDVNLDLLVKVGDLIRVSDVRFPEGVTCFDKPDTVVATIEAMKEEKEEIPVSAEQEKAAIENLTTEQQLKAKEKAKETDEKTAAESK